MMRPILWACLGFCLSTASSTAQESNDPRIVLVHPGITALNADLLSLTNLTSQEEQAYGEDLEAFIQDFSPGIDTEKPLLFDVISSTTPVTYLFWMPYSDRLDFLDNLDSIGFPAFVQNESPNFFLIDDTVDQGWLRLLPAASDPVESGYAVLALPTPETLQAVRQLVLDAHLPVDDLKRLAPQQASVLIHLQNTAQEVADQTQRRESFASIRAEDMQTIQRRPAEAETEFALRRGSSEVFYDEVERIYAEAADVDLRAVLDRDQSQIDVLFDLTGIAQSTLAESNALFGQTADAFDAIQPLPQTVLSGRLNHPVDELRQQNADTYLNLLTADVHRRIATSETLQDSEKQATQKIYDDLIQVFRDGFASGNVNGFVEAIHDGTDFTLVGAVSAPGSESLTATLEQLPLARAGNEVELGVASEGQVTIHRMRLAEDFVTLADTLFGVGRDFWVGVGQDQVWLATGPGSQELLIAKVKEAAAPAMNATVLTVQASLGPWVQRLYELAQEREQPEAVEDRAAWREDLVRMQQMAESLTADDEVELSVQSEAMTMSGRLHLNRGLLKFLGRQIAKLTKENLDL